jgi:hypothetical protein
MVAQTISEKHFLKEFLMVGSAGLCGLRRVRCKALEREAFIAENRFIFKTRFCPFALHLADLQAAGTGAPGQSHLSERVKFR